MVDNDVAERFMRAPFLAEVTADARRTLLDAMEEHRAPSGMVLLRQGEPNDRIFFLIEGAVSILRRMPDGHAEPILDLAAPTAFGETSFFQRKPQLVSVRAIAELHYLTLGRAAHERLRVDDPHASEQLAMAAIRVLASHFEIIDQRVAELLAQHPDPGSETTEWDRFRARLFGEARF